jgi:hypothetical protein
MSIARLVSTPRDLEHITLDPRMRRPPSNLGNNGAPCALHTESQAQSRVSSLSMRRRPWPPNRTKTLTARSASSARSPMRATCPPRPLHLSARPSFSSQSYLQSGFCTSRRKFQRPSSRPRRPGLRKPLTSRQAAAGWRGTLRGRRRSQMTSDRRTASDTIWHLLRAATRVCGGLLSIISASGAYDAGDDELDSSMYVAFAGIQRAGPCSVAWWLGAKVSACRSPRDESIKRKIRSGAPRPRRWPSSPYVATQRERSDTWRAQRVALAAWLLPLPDPMLPGIRHRRRSTEARCDNR